MKAFLGYKLLFNGVKRLVALNQIENGEGGSTQVIHSRSNGNRKGVFTDDEWLVLISSSSWSEVPPKTNRKEVNHHIPFKRGVIPILPVASGFRPFRR